MTALTVLVHVLDEISLRLELPGQLICSNEAERSLLVLLGFVVFHLVNVRRFIIITGHI